MLAKWVQFVVLVGMFLFFTLVFVFVVIPYFIILRTYRILRNSFNWVMGVVIEIFEYNTSVPYLQNFNRWFSMNCHERSIYKEPNMTEKEASVVFRRQYKQHDNNDVELRSYAAEILGSK